jgi:hypothetical protein
MRLVSLFFFSFLALYCTSAKSENPGNLFGVTLGQDVVGLPSIEAFGNAAMQYSFAPRKPTKPFDLYSVYANNDFAVQTIYARAKVSSDECEGKLRKTAHQIEASHGVKFEAILRSKKTVFVSEDDVSFMEMSCTRYRRLRKEQFKDIYLLLASKETTSVSSKVDTKKRAKISTIIGENKRKKREIKLESNHDFSGGWASDCTEKNSGIGIKKIRDNYYHFLLCGAMKCINVPRISSSDVEIVDNTRLKIAGQQYKLCTAWNK